VSKKIVVIGAAAAGLRAAARAKRLLPKAEIIVLDASEVISYGACGLPYFVSGDIQSLQALRATAWGTVRDPEFFAAAKALDVRTGKRVTGIDRDGRSVRFVDAGSGEEQSLPYDRLVIATGARPRPLPGLPPDDPRISFFKTTEDALRWRQSLERGELQSVAIIGGGYIGCELAEAFRAIWGCEVELIEALDQVLAQVLDPEMAALVQAHLVEQKVNLHTGTRCERLESNGDELIIHTNRDPIRTQHAICAIGFVPEVGFARDAGLTTGSSGGLVVDEQLRTSDPYIFAAGDCIEVRHRITGQPAYIPLGSLANRQGRVLGDVLAGRDVSFGPVVGSGAVKVFDLNVASTGLSETAAARAGLAVEAVWGTFSDKADYYPEYKNICCKLVYTKDEGVLLGLQAVGPGEVVKRVDVFANLLHRAGTVDDLLDLEFAYAPPYAPAVDPLFALGCAAGNQIRDGIASISPGSGWVDSGGYRTIDVRSRQEVESNPLPGDDILCIPYEEVRARVGEIPRDRPLRVVCAKGVRSAETVRVLLQAGIERVVYVGGGNRMRS